MKRHRAHIIQDFFIIAISFALAIYAVYTGLTDVIVGTFSYAFDSVAESASLPTATTAAAQYLPYLGIFLAGMFFTSAFTTAPAIAILGEFAKHNNLIAVAVIGGLGAAIGDYILFKFVKDRVADDLRYLFHNTHAGKIRTFRKRLLAVFHTKLFHWFAPFIGGLIIASPLPDEFGIAILGLSRMRDGVFIPVSFVFNCIGIYVIGWAVTTVL